MGLLFRATVHMPEAQMLRKHACWLRSQTRPNGPLSEEQLRELLEACILRCQAFTVSMLIQGYEAGEAEAAKVWPPVAGA